MSKTNILIFSKAPIAGQVKTRLIPTIGAQAAAKIHLALLNSVIRVVSAVEDASVQLWLTSDLGDPTIQELCFHFNIELFQQVGRNLGERMQFAVDQALPHCEQVVLIGGDCISVTVNYVNKAIDAFGVEQGNDIVLGPAEDGGYILLGIGNHVSNGDRAALFSDIDWGGPTVLSQSLMKAQQAGLKSAQLDVGWDVDRWEDVRRAMNLGLLTLETLDL